jgi:hypothetical protein
VIIADDVCQQPIWRWRDPVARHGHGGGGRCLLSAALTVDLDAQSARASHGGWIRASSSSA